MKKQIGIDSVYLNFGAFELLKGISFSTEEHEITGILGRNGCGKSCLLKILTGQINPQSKHIRVNNQYHKHLYKKPGLINYLPQHEFHPQSLSLKSLLKHYGIKEAEFCYYYPFTESLLAKKLKQLSGGERRLIEVLLILESPVHFSILDEPFSHIMPKHVDLIKDNIQRLKDRKGFILTDHQYKNVLELSDKLYVIQAGRMTQISGQEDLRLWGYIR